jgi:anti-sigma factor RsiW
MTEVPSMTTECRRTFDESLLSGYLDDALMQHDEQRVRLHLEECPTCRAEVEEMRRLREVTMSTPFEVPQDLQWDERPQSGPSRLFRSLGSLLTAVWLVGFLGFAAVELWAGAANTTERVLLFGGISGFGLLFLSVLADRWKALKSDRYTEVRK